MAVKGKYFDQITPRFEREKVIIVEGTDDAIFLDLLMDSMGIDTQEIGVCIANGKDKIFDLIETMKLSPSFTSKKIRGYAVIRDVDAEPSKSLDEISKIFRDLAEPQPSHGQFVTRSDGRIVGLYLMPDFYARWKFGNLAVETIPENVLLKAAATFVKTSEDIGGRNSHTNKRHVQAFLAIASLPFATVRAGGKAGII